MPVTRPVPVHRYADVLTLAVLASRLGRATIDGEDEPGT